MITFAMAPTALLNVDTAVPSSSVMHTQDERAKVVIVDIRRRNITWDIRNDMLGKLRPSEGNEKKMPTILLYDETGLKLFEAITFLDEVFIPSWIDAWLDYIMPTNI